MVFIVKSISIFLASIGFTLPFLYPSRCWPLTFISLIPFFYAHLLGTRLSCKYGFFAGIIIFSVHLHGMLIPLIHMNTKFLHQFFIPTGIMLYGGFLVGAWWQINNYLQYYCHHYYSTLLIIITTTTFFILFLDYYSFSICGLAHGCMIFDPLLPLAMHPPLLQLLSIVGKPCLLLIFLCVPASFTLVLFNMFSSIHSSTPNGYVEHSERTGKVYYAQNHLPLCLLIIACIPWIYSYMHHPPHVPIPAWIAYVAPIACMFPNTNSLIHITTPLLHQYAYHGKSIIIMPESACRTALEREQLQNNPIFNTIHFIVGSFYHHNNAYYNAAYWFAQGELKKIFCKKLIVPFLEYAPYALLHTGYCDMPCNPGIQERMPFKVNDNCTLIPYLCSELFFNEYPDHTYEDCTIIALCNDLWTPYTYIKQLMALMAQFKALQWHQPIIYCSYTYCLYITPQAEVYSLTL